MGQVLACSTYDSSNDDSYEYNTSIINRILAYASKIYGFHFRNIPKLKNLRFTGFHANQTKPDLVNKLQKDLTCLSFVTTVIIFRYPFSGKMYTEHTIFIKNAEKNLSVEFNVYQIKSN